MYISDKICMKILSAVPRRKPNCEKDALYCHVQESFKKSYIAIRDPETGDFQNISISSLPKDRYLVKFSCRSGQKALNIREIARRQTGKRPIFGGSINRCTRISNVYDNFSLQHFSLQHLYSNISPSIPVML